MSFHARLMIKVALRLVKLLLPSCPQHSKTKRSPFKLKTHNSSFQLSFCLDSYLTLILTSAQIKTRLDTQLKKCQPTKLMATSRRRLFRSILNSSNDLYQTALACLSGLLLRRMSFSVTQRTSIPTVRTSLQVTRHMTASCQSITTQNCSCYSTSCMRLRSQEPRPNLWHAWSASCSQIHLIRSSYLESVDMLSAKIVSASTSNTSLKKVKLID